MKINATLHSDLAVQVKRAHTALVRHDKKIKRTQTMCRFLFRSTFFSVIFMGTGAFATLLGAASLTHTHLHADDALPHHTSVLEKLPPQTITAGLTGLLGGLALIVGFGFAAQTQARRCGPLTEKRYQLYLAHEELREKFNTQAQQPPPVDHEPRLPISLRQPVTLTVTTRTFKSAVRPQA